MFHPLRLFGIIGAEDANLTIEYKNCSDWVLTLLNSYEEENITSLETHVEFSNVTFNNQILF